MKLFGKPRLCFRQGYDNPARPVDVLRLGAVVQMPRQAGFQVAKNQATHTLIGSALLLLRPTQKLSRGLWALMQNLASIQR